MIRLSASVAGGDLSTGVEAEEAQQVLFQAEDRDLEQTIEGRIEVDDDLNELRIIVDGECVWSTFMQAKEEDSNA